MSQIPDNAQLKNIYDDITFIQEEWSGGSVSEQTLRRNATLLRRFIHYRELLEAWKAVIGRERYTIQALTLERLVGTSDFRGITFAAVGGAQRPGMQVAAAQVYNRVLTQQEIQAQFKLGPPIPVDMSFQQFVEGACIVVEGTPISRRNLVKYVANKLGDAHYDPKRDKRWQRLLDKAQEFSITDMNAIYHELLSMAQVIGSSPDTARLIEAIRQRLQLP